MIISAGDFLIRALKPAAARLQWERVALVALVGAALGEFLAVNHSEQKCRYIKTCLGHTKLAAGWVMTTSWGNKSINDVEKWVILMCVYAAQVWQHSNCED